ncbi:hypothetical protein RND71_016231 [Anisodus tanguticus]|uniref:Uncharacterized protein n=1 Tax=Anisodus tanguticus TaxID=243964 RepID=A0AAE1S6Z3_9SOLA|nr:hypothetical protein RND71_016231 [Anisodus tanguticus]
MKTEIVEGENGGCAETDPDTDPEAQQVHENNVFFEIGPKRQRRRTKTKRYKMEERLNPWRRILNENRRHGNSSFEIKRETSSLEEKAELPNLSMVSKVKVGRLM